MSSVASVGSRGRTSLRVDALLEMTLGLILMGNPLFGPALGVSGYLIMLSGFLLLVVAVFLGGAGLAKGFLAGRLALVRVCNVLGGLVVATWAAIGSLTTGARIFLALVAAAHLAMALLQERALRHPEPKFVRVPSTHAQRQAALRGEHGNERKT